MQGSEQSKNKNYLHNRLKVDAPIISTKLQNGTDDWNFLVQEPTCNIYAG